MKSNAALLARKGDGGRVAGMSAWHPFEGARPIEGQRQGVAASFRPGAPR